MPATIFSGQKIKTLKDTLTLNGKSDIISSTVDPTASAVDAPIGSLLINQTSGKLYRKLDAGSSVNWEEVGAGVGGINYILNPSAEVNTTGWVTYADAAGTAPVDGTGGSPSVTWSRSTTSPLRGIADFNLVKDAANRQGQGVSYDFTIDEADKAKVLSVTFDYEVLSGTYADGDLTVYLIADPTGTPVVIQPAGYTVQSATVGTTMREIATFQTQATGTSYRLCFHVASTSTSAYTLAIDNVVVGPQQTVQGAAISDWVSYTPTVTPSSGSITNYTASARYRRVGDSMEISGSMIFSAASAVFSNVIVSIPSGFTIDASKAPSARLGSGTIVDAGVGYYPLEAIYQSATAVVLYVGNSGGSYLADNNITNAIPFTFGLNDAISFIFTVPITGWSSNTVMSQDTDTRVVAARYNASSGSIGALGIVDFSSKSLDTHGAVTTGASWKFTAPVSGIYKVDVIINLANTAAASTLLAYLYKNGVQEAQFKGDSQAPTGGNNTLRSASGSVLVELQAGQYIDIRASSSTTLSILTGTGDTSVSIQRLSGPATIAASETVAMRRNSSSGQTINSAITSIVNFEIAGFDTHSAWRAASGAYNAATGTWATTNPGFVAPVSGVYLVAGCIGFDATSAFFTTVAYNIVRVNGTGIFTSSDFFSTNGTIKISSFSGLVRCLAGDVIDVVCRQETGAARNLQPYTSDRTCLTIVRVGN